MSENIEDKPFEFTELDEDVVDKVPHEIQPYNLGHQALERRRATIMQRSAKLSENTDADYAKNNLKDLVETGMTVLESLVEFAEQSEQARVYEVLATFMQTMATINLNIMDVNKKQVDITGKNTPIPTGGQPVSGGTVTNIQQNTVFLGTPADLNKFLADNNMLSTEKFLMEQGDTIEHEST